MIRTLYDDINEVVVRRLSNALLTNQKVNLPEWVSDVTEALAEMILQQSEIEQADLVAHAHEQLDYFIREKS
jgi:hypothetical protein